MKKTNINIIRVFAFFAAIAMATIMSHPCYGSTDEKEWKGVFFSYDNMAKAKYHAYENHRPLLVILSMNPCSNCTAFKSNIVNESSGTFRKFISDNKIVTCVATNNALVTNIPKKYKEASFSSTPFVLLFKVNSTANFTTVSSSALNPDTEVELLKTSAFACGGSYVAGSSLFGISNGSSTSAWNPTTFTNQIKACFPNQEWDTIKPEDGGNTEEGGNTGTEGGNDEGDGGNTGTEGGNTGGNTGTEGGNTGTEGGNTGGNTGTEGGNTESGATPTDENLWKGVTFTYNSIHTAKYHAFNNGVPLLVVISMNPCSNCTSFKSKIIDSATFKNYAKNNRFVLCTVTNNSLVASLPKKYKDSNASFSATPFVMMFKVLKTADFTKSSTSALDPGTEVELLKTKKFDCGGSYVGGSSLFGISNGTTSNWNGATFIKQIEACFPNQYWQSIGASMTEPVDDDSTGGNDDDPSGNDTPDTPAADGNWTSKIYAFTELSEAKKYAYVNNRPLLVILSMSPCSNCTAFKNQIVNDEDREFRNYVKTNKIVVCAATNNALVTAIPKKYKEVQFSSTPFVMLFKVLDTATFTSNDSNSLNPGTEVEMLYTSSFKCGGSYVTNENLFGINNGSTTAWSPSTFNKQLAACFPNQYWKTITPPAIGPTGYENAIDMGIIPSEENPPLVNGQLDGSKWVKASGVQTIKGTAPQLWFKFQGYPGRRYYFYADSAEITTTKDYSLKASLFATGSDKPVLPALGTFASTNLTNLNRGFYFDTPAGNNTLTQYYLEIAGNGGTSTSTAAFNLKVHETIASPAPGALTNPIYATADKGKWSVATDKVLEASFNDNAPVLAYFSGLPWCPWCAGFEKTILSKEAFSNGVKDYYLLDFDFQKRNGTGPSLWTDDSGYLKTNAISASTATAKLADNKAWQEKLALPNSERDFWPNGSIGYPTIVVCRTIKDASGNYDLEAIGRISSAASVDAALATLADNKALFDSGYRESSSRIETSKEVIEKQEAGSADLKLGKSATAYYTKFTSDNGLSWDFNLIAANAADNATVKLTIYSEDGSEILKSAEGSLKNGVDILFTPAGTDAENVWLKIEIANQDTLVDCTLDYTQYAIAYGLSMPKSTLSISRNANMVSIPVNVKILQQKDDDVTFEYRVWPTDSIKDHTDYFGKQDWTGFTAQAAAVLNIDIPITIPAEDASWEDTMDFTVEIRNIDESSSLIQGNDTTTVKITSNPMFLPRPETTSYTLYKDLGTTITLPVCTMPGMKVVSDMDLPSGMKLVNNTSDPDSPCLTITGTPTKTTTSTKKSTITLKNSEGENTDTIAIKITVSTADSQAMQINNFVAPLYIKDDAANKINGLLLISRDSNGLQLTINSNDLPEAMDIAIQDWSYNPTSKTLEINQQLDGGKSIAVSVNSDGSGSATFASSYKTYEGKVSPITNSPNEFTGTYNAAIRPMNDTFGISLGWMQIHVDDTGHATLIAQLYNGTEELVLDSVIYDGTDGNGYIPFYTSLNGDSSNTGSLSGTLTVVPISSRSTSTTEAYVRGCDYADCYLVDLEAKTTALTVCGTIYDATKSVNESVESDYYFFFAEAPEKCLVPNCIRIQEVAAEHSFLPSQTNGFMYEQLGAFKIEQATGMFTVDLNVLTMNSKNLVTPVAVKAEGIIVPTTSSCCSISDNIAIAYGSYTYNGTIQTVRIMTYEYGQTAKPTAAVTSIEAPMGVKCTAPTKAILYKRLDTDALYAKTWTAKTNYVNLSLTETAPWMFTALTTDSSEYKTESEPVIVEPIAGSKSYQFSMNSSSLGTMTPGWNIISMPLNLAIPEQTLKKSAFEISQETGLMIKAQLLIPGNAYWIFIKDASDSFSFKATPMKSWTATPQEPPVGWSMRAFTGYDKNLEMYKYENGTFEILEPNDTVPELSGVLIFKKVE